MKFELDNQKSNELKNERSQTIKNLFAKLDKGEKTSELKPESKGLNLWGKN